MSISTYAPREEYVGTGLLKDYTFDFKIADLSHLLIVVSDASFVEQFRVRGTDVVYLTSVDFDSVAGGGTIHLTSFLTLNYNLAILLANDAPLQESEFKNKSDFVLSRFESALDVLSGAIQRLAYLVGRSPRASEEILDTTVAAFNWEIPDPTGQIGKKLTVNPAGNGFIWT